MQVRLLHVITGLATGGAEMMLCKLLERLDRTRFSCGVISLQDQGDLGGKIRRMGIPLSMLGIGRGQLSIAGVIRLKKIVRAFSPDLLQGWMYHGNLAAMLCGGNAPVIWNIRQSLYNTAEERWLTRAVIRIGAHLSRCPEAILYNSVASADQHEARGFCPANRVIIPNGFDTEKFRPSDEARVRVREELGVPQDTILIGLIARYHPIKDHANFLRAAAILRQKLSLPIHFLLAGEGIDRGNRELMASVQSLGLANNVGLLGRRDDISRLTAALDVGSSASWGEAFPNVLGEAMSCSVPCVATDVGDSAWIVGNTGKVVAPRNHEELAAAWIEMIEMGEEGRRRLGRSARQRIVGQFGIGSVAKKYEQLYDSVLTKAA